MEKDGAGHDAHLRVLFDLLQALSQCVEESYLRQIRIRRGQIRPQHGRSSRWPYGPCVDRTKCTRQGKGWRVERVIKCCLLSQPVIVVLSSIHGIQHIISADVGEV